MPVQKPEATTDWIGGAWLASTYGLELVMPLRVISRVGGRRSTTGADGITTETFVAAMRPAPTWRGHLTFHLKHEVPHLELLARLFERVVVATPRERIAGDVPLVTALGIHRRLARLAVEVRPFHELSVESRLEDGVAALANVYTGELSLVEDVALISYSTPRVPDLALLAPLRALGLRVATIGDCRMPRGVAAATAEGYAAAMAL